MRSGDVTLNYICNKQKKIENNNITPPPQDNI